MPTVDTNAADMNSFYLIWAASLVFFMQAGFGMLEAGAIRAKNQGNIVYKNCIDASIAAIVWWICGYGFAFGGDAENRTFRNGFIGNGDFTLVSSALVDGVFPATQYAIWFFQWAFAATAATIVAGAVAERCNPLSYCIFSIFITGFIYPVVVHWVWSGAGWLSAFSYGTTGPDQWYTHIGDAGLIDFAGSGVVHLTGGAAALAGAICIGPRRGRFGPPGEDAEAAAIREEAFEASNKVLMALGTLILWFGWYGFNCGSTLAVSDGLAELAAKVAVTTTLSAGAGGLMTGIIYRFMVGHLDIGHTLNGILAGLVSITASCSVVEPWAAIVIGIIGAFFYSAFDRFLLAVRIDDPLQASCVHGACGVWGLLSNGFFATQTNIAGGYYGRLTNEWGVFYGGGWEVLGVQVLGALCIAVWSFSLSFLMFFLLNMAGLLRVSPEAEEAGLDITEHGFGAGAAKDFADAPIADTYDPVAKYPTYDPVPSPALPTYVM